VSPGSSTLILRTESVRSASDQWEHVSAVWKLLPCWTDGQCCVFYGRKVSLTMKFIKKWLSPEWKSLVLSTQSSSWY